MCWLKVEKKYRNRVRDFSVIITGMGMFYVEKYPQRIL